MRKETSNTWSDGLIMDLNPLNTPNTVLTDNLNGTLITYNGNEHSLQNDMGNYKLENCRLTPNYVPVGLKQYGDILYIVSYNPLDQTTEIGSYPSPLQVNTGNPLSDNKSIQYAIIKTLENKNEFTTEEVEQNQFHIIFAEENLKLNPGDLYKLTIGNTEVPPKYEALEYYVVDEDKKLHAVTSLVESKLLIPGDKNVPWTVPGWLSVKSRIVQFDRFSMDILNFKVYDEVGMGRFRFQFAINDLHLIKLYNKNKSQFLKDLKVKFEIYKKDGENVPLLKEWDLSVYNENYIVKEWYDNNIIVQFDFDFSNLPLLDNDFVKFRAIPYLVEETNNYTYKLVYEKLIQEIETGIENIVVLTSKNVALGLETYKFRISNDESSVELEFDLSNPDLEDSEASFIDPSLSLWYMIYDLNGNKVFDKFKRIVTSGLGTYTLNIDFDNDFQIENIYVIQFVLSKSEPTPNSDAHWSKDQSDTIGSKMLVTSKVFNEFYKEEYSKFDEEIEFDVWVNRYLKSVYNDSNIEVTSSPIITRIKEVSSRVTNNDNYWNDNIPFNTFALLGESIENEKVVLGHECEVSVELSNGLEESMTNNKIGMWNTLFPDKSTVEVKVTDASGRLVSVPVDVSGKEASMDKAILLKDRLIYRTHSLLEGTCVATESDPIQFQPFSSKTLKEKWGVGNYKSSDKIVQNLMFSFGKIRDKNGHTVEIASWDPSGVSNAVSLKLETFNDGNRGLDKEPATWFKFKNDKIPFYYTRFRIYHSGNSNDWFGLQAVWESGGSSEDGIGFVTFEGDYGLYYEDFIAFRMDNGSGKDENLVFLPSSKDQNKYLDYIVVDPLGESGTYSQWKFEDIDWNLRNNIGAKILVKINPLPTWQYCGKNLYSSTERQVLSAKFIGVNNTLIGGFNNLQLDPVATPVSDFNYTYSYEENEFPYLNSDTTNGKTYWDSVYKNKLREVYSHMQEWNNSIVSKEFANRGYNVKGIYHPEGTSTYSNSDFVKQTTLFYRKHNVPGFSYVESDSQTHFDTTLYKLAVFVTDSGNRMRDYVGYYLNEIS